MLLHAGGLSRHWAALACLAAVGCRARRSGRRGRRTAACVDGRGNADASPTPRRRRGDVRRLGRRRAAADRPGLGGRRGVLPDLSRAIPQRRPDERSDARLAGVPRDRARVVGRLAVDGRLVRPRRLGASSSATTSSRTACSTAATAATCRACSTSSTTSQELGVNTLYFNPVFYGRSLHKYDAASMHHIDPYFGPDPAGDLELIAAETSDPESWHWTAADKLFLKLVDELHARGMRVIIDGVFNHTGRDFFAFADLREKQAESPYRDWYIVAALRRSGDAARTSFATRAGGASTRCPSSPTPTAGNDLHPGAEAVRASTSRGGGWTPTATATRATASTAGGSTWPTKCRSQFWQRVARSWCASSTRRRTRSAEIWDDAREFLAGGGFSATMNYHAFAFPAKGFLIDGRLSAHDFGRELQLRRAASIRRRCSLRCRTWSTRTTPIALASMIVNRPDRRAVPAGRPVRLRRVAARVAAARSDVRRAAARRSASGGFSGWSCCCR